MKEELEIGDSVYAYFENEIPLEFKIEKEISNSMYAVAENKFGYNASLAFKKKVKDGKISLIRGTFLGNKPIKLVLKTDETEKMFNNNLKRFQMLDEIKNTGFKHLNEKELDNILKIVKNDGSKGNKLYSL